MILVRSVQDHAGGSQPDPTISADSRTRRPLLPARLTRRALRGGSVAGPALATEPFRRAPSLIITMALPHVPDRQPGIRLSDVPFALVIGLFPCCLHLFVILLLPTLTQKSCILLLDPLPITPRHY